MLLVAPSEITPSKIELSPKNPEPTVSTRSAPPLLVTVPAPSNERTLVSPPAMSRVAPASTVVEEMKSSRELPALPVPISSVPAATTTEAEEFAANKLFTTTVPSSPARPKRRIELLPEGLTSFNSSRFPLVAASVEVVLPVVEKVLPSTRSPCPSTVPP